MDPETALEVLYKLGPQDGSQLWNIMAWVLIGVILFFCGYVILIACRFAHRRGYLSLLCMRCGVCCPTSLEVVELGQIEMAVVDR